MVHTRSRFKDFTALTVALTAIWRDQFVEDSAVRALFNEQDSNKAVERVKGLGSMGLVPKHQGTLEAKRIDPKDRADYEHEEYADMIAIERKLIDDDDINAVTAILSEYGMSYNRTYVYHMSSVFNNAFSASFAGPDGKALCATGRNSGKAVLNNKGTSALSHASVTETREAMRQFKDDNGLVLNVNPNLLVVPVGLEEEAIEITNSERRSDNANNATNANRGLGYVVDPLLTDANNWFMVDSALSQRYLRWWWRVRPTSTDGFAVDPKSEFDLEYRARGYMRYSFGWDRHTFIYGHEVSDS